MVTDKQEMRLYKTPLTPSYWRAAIASAKNLKLLVFAAFMIAAANVLSALPSIPVTAHTKFGISFLARALCALVCGPVMGVAYGFVEDITGFIMHPKGAFFPGYTLSTMAGMLVYALCFYRAKITIWRLLLANLLVNFFVNAVMGSVWNVMLRGSSYWFYFSKSLLSNSITLIPKVILMTVVYQALLPVMQRMGVIPKQVDGVIKLF